MQNQKWYNAAEEDQRKYLKGWKTATVGWRTGKGPSNVQTLLLMPPKHAPKIVGSRAFRNHLIRRPLMGGEGAPVAGPNPSSYPLSKQIFYVFSL
jgi:hypothetical protein